MTMLSGESQGIVSRCVMQTLESRLLFSTPASPRADTLGAIFDRSERQDLLDRLTHLNSGDRAVLQRRLAESPGKFDISLLSYMRTRDSAEFFFDPTNVDDVGSFIANNNVSYTDIRNRSNAIVDNRLFPEQSSSKTFTVSVPSPINFVANTASDNPEFLHTLNRHDWWRELAWTSAITGDGKYAEEVHYELAQWSQQFTTAGLPAAWSKSDQAGWQLDSAIRTESWTWAYFGFLHHDGFTPAENSLFLYKFAQTADFLYQRALTTTDFLSNRTIVLGKALLYLGRMFNELDDAATWETTGRNLLFKCLNTQVYDDGSHVEQSPGYAFNVADDLLDARQLDRLNGKGWPTEMKRKLVNVIDSYWQFLSPNGTRPAVGDTYRTDERGVFLKPNLVLETSRWPAAKPRPRDVFVAGAAAVTPYLNAPVAAASLGTRGDTYAMPDSGNYIMRSGDDTGARQIIFDAGPKGGPHGHFDLLNFELSGYGRPLISDPGAFRYDTSADRAYVISTAAHNTLNIDGANHREVRSSGSDDILVSQWRHNDEFAQVTATHFAYDHLAGSPVVTRSIWYDQNGTMIIVDWAQGSVRHDYQQSFNLQTEGDVNNVTVDAANLTARTRYSSGGNVQISGIRHNDGQTAVKGALTFVTNSVGGDFKDDAYRFRLNQSGKFVVFVTLVSAYNGTTPPNTTARLLNAPGENTALSVELNQNGSKRTIDFSRPPLGPLDARGTSRGRFNDIAYDASNRLHMAYGDRDTGALMYAVRDANGAWSKPAILDPAASDDADGEFQFVSMAIDNSGSPAVAYFDGWNGDLRYAVRNPATGKWSGQVIDSKGSTGLYPSLAFGRDGRPAISYYNRGTKDLMLARGTAGGGFTLAAIETTGDVGRFSSLLLDPNRSSITRWTLGYEDTTRGNFKFAIEGEFDGGTRANGFTSYVVDDLPEGGGYVSLAYYDNGGPSGKRYQPAMTYYDASESALKYAKSADRGATWSKQFVATPGAQGLYSNLLFDSANKATIYFYDRTHNEARRAVFNGSGWDLADLRAGGREMHIAVNRAGAVAYSTLNESNGQLTVHNA